MKRWFILLVCDFAIVLLTFLIRQQSGVILINLLLDIEKALRSPQREYDALAKAIEKQLFEDEELVQTLKARDRRFSFKINAKISGLWNANLTLVFTGFVKQCWN